MPRRGPKSTEAGFPIKGSDPGTGRSISITIYPGMDRLDEVMRYLQTTAERRYKTTKITDRRHKRR